jgi:hypothetical protein
MKTIEHTVDIAASPEVVWAILTDVEAFPEWNPFLTMDRSPTAVGERLRITVKPGRRTMTFRPTVTLHDPGHQMAWLGRFLAPGIVDGAHSFTLEALPDGGTRFCQREVFRGVLVPFMSSMLGDTSAGFAAMNEALAARASSQPRSITS